MQYFVRAGALAGFFDLVTSRGANPIEILHQSNILPSQLNDPDTMLPYEKLGDVLERAANHVGMPEFGARLSISQGLSAMGLLGMYMVQQKDIEASLACARKFAYMHAQGVFIDVNPINEEYCKLTMELSVNSRRQFPQLTQLSIGVAYRIVSEMMGGNWHANSITFVQLQSQSLQKRLSQMFACDVQFGSLVDSIIFPLDVLKRKPIHSANLLNEVINKQFMHMHSNKPDMIALVRHAINMLLPTGDCSKENIALSLGIHPKKLERILGDKQLTYRDLLESTRRSIAISTLDTNHMALTNLALNLGYSDFSAFSRSFKKWFGVSPSRYKNKKTF